MNISITLSFKTYCVWYDASSLKIEPSFIEIILFAYTLAASWSWETKITKWFFASSLKILYISSFVLLSKLPVGSSAKITYGFFAIVLNIWILCFWPPDNSVVFLSNKSLTPKSWARFKKSKLLLSFFSSDNNILSFTSRFLSK